MDSTNTDKPKYDAWQAAIDYGIDMSLVEYNLSLTPEELILNHERACEYIKKMNLPECDYYGINARRPDWIAYCSISRKKQETHVLDPREIMQ